MHKQTPLIYIKLQKKIKILFIVFPLLCRFETCNEIIFYQNKRKSNRPVTYSRVGCNLIVYCCIVVYSLITPIQAVICHSKSEITQLFIIQFQLMWYCYGRCGKFRIQFI